MNFKQEIANCIKFELENINFADFISESSTPDKGDFCLPCFPFAKMLHDSPVNIATKISNGLVDSKLIAKTEVVNGYVNFFLNKEYLAQEILTKFNIKQLKTTEGKNKVVLIDYGSPNLAKYLHIGHLKTTIIGESLARMYEQLGYTVKRLNYLGDYGTPFGKIIGGLLKWGNMEEVNARGNDALQEYYVRFNKEEETDPSLTQYARDIFKKIEQKDETIYPIYKQIIKIALDDAIRMFDMLGVKFDDYRGEMYYNQFVPNIIKMLKDKHLLKTSEGASIVDLQDYNMPPALVLKSDGTSLYTTRDICAVIEREKDYHFDKMIYVTDVAQTLNFKQLFKVMELAGYPFYKDMEHIAYGRFSLPEGKISSRRGKQAVLVDLLDYVLKKANEVIADRQFSVENPADVANKVARGVLNYNVLKVERTKDCVFDMEKAFAFDGETSPYMQYTYTRLESILRKYTQTNPPKTNKLDYSWIDNEALSLIKLINDFGQTIKTALTKRDASIIANKIMDMCKIFNKFYSTTKVLDGNNATTQAKIKLISALRDTLSVGFYLICIDTLKEM